jgi:hypothetical protein
MVSSLRAIRFDEGEYKFSINLNFLINILRSENGLFLLFRFKLASLFVLLKT